MKIGEPARLYDLQRRSEQERGQQQRAGGHQHQKRKHPVLPEVALPFDAPRVIDGCVDGVEHAERRPQQRHRAAEPQADRRLPEGVELRGDEIELTRKITEHERQHRETVGVGRRHAAENGNDERTQTAKAIREEGEHPLNIVPQ